MGKRSSKKKSSNSNNVHNNNKSTNGGNSNNSNNSNNSKKKRKQSKTQGKGNKYSKQSIHHHHYYIIPMQPTASNMIPMQPIADSSSSNIIRSSCCGNERENESSSCNRNEGEHVTSSTSYSRNESGFASYNSNEGGITSSNSTTSYSGNEGGTISSDRTLSYNSNEGGSIGNNSSTGKKQIVDNRFSSYYGNEEKSNHSLAHRGDELGIASYSMHHVHPPYLLTDTNNIPSPYGYPGYVFSNVNPFKNNQQVDDDNKKRKSKKQVEREKKNNLIKKQKAEKEQILNEKDKNIAQLEYDTSRMYIDSKDKITFKGTVKELKIMVKKLNISMSEEELEKENALLKKYPEYVLNAKLYNSIFQNYFQSSNMHTTKENVIVIIYEEFDQQGTLFGKITVYFCKIGDRYCILEKGQNKNIVMFKILLEIYKIVMPKEEVNFNGFLSMLCELNEKRVAVINDSKYKHLRNKNDYSKKIDKNLVSQLNSRDDKLLLLNYLRDIQVIDCKNYVYYKEMILKKKSSIEFNNKTNLEGDLKNLKMNHDGIQKSNNNELNNAMQIDSLNEKETFNILTLPENLNHYKENHQSLLQPPCTTVVDKEVVVPIVEPQVVVPQVVEPQVPIVEPQVVTPQVPIVESQVLIVESQVLIVEPQLVILQVPIVEPQVVVPQVPIVESQVVVPQIVEPQIPIVEPQVVVPQVPIVESQVVVPQVVEQQVPIVESQVVVPQVVEPQVTTVESQIPIVEPQVVTPQVPTVEPQVTIVEPQVSTTTLASIPSAINIITPPTSDQSITLLNVSNNSSTLTTRKQKYIAWSNMEFADLKGTKNYRDSKLERDFDYEDKYSFLSFEESLQCTLYYNNTKGFIPLQEVDFHSLSMTMFLSPTVFNLEKVDLSVVKLNDYLKHNDINEIFREGLKIIDFKAFANVDDCKIYLSEMTIA
ncbi:hypothetical protein ABK040_011048 [Willaertia magna]